jgi:hypothetical protein
MSGHFLFDKYLGSHKFANIPKKNCGSKVFVYLSTLVYN